MMRNGHASEKENSASTTLVIKHTLSTNFRLLAVRYLDLHPLSQERAVTAKEQALWYNILLFCWDISADIKL
jgi:hypothetical protein